MFQYGTDGFRNIILKKVVIKKKKDIGVCYRRGDVNQGWFRVHLLALIGCNNRA